MLAAALDGGVCLVTPFCERGCLADRIDSMSWFHRLSAARGFFRGLKELHKARVTHGAVKPGNVFITRSRDGDLDAAVGDADFLGDSLRDALGKLKPDDATRNYYAPEVLAGDACTPESDVYGAGVVLLLLTSNEGACPCRGRRRTARARGAVGGGGDAESAGGGSAERSGRRGLARGDREGGDRARGGVRPPQPRAQEDVSARGKGAGDGDRRLRRARRRPRSCAAT